MEDVNSIYARSHDGKKTFRVMTVTVLVRSLRYDAVSIKSNDRQVTKVSC